MSHVFPRQITAPPVKAIASAGCHIIDETGKRYLDGSGGAAVSCLGHGDPEVIAAIQKQTETLAFAHTGFFTSDPAEELADLLIE
ncbi:MAG: aminotransferase class III-fold pyridoxal phosphate-dependent enzyme, partial [Paracoccaceae bacterium]